MKLLQVILVALIVMCPAISSAEIEVSPDLAQIDEVQVDGEYPGPAMWKVSHPSDPNGNVMWIVGDIELLPRKIKWKSREIEDAVRAASEVLLMPTVDVRPEGQIDIGTGLSLLRSALGVRKNPNKAKLKDVLNEDLYRRWREQKRIYLSRNRSIERWRPIFAGPKLTDKAIKRLKLRREGVVWGAVSKIVERHDIETTRPTVAISVPAEQLKLALQQFSQEHLADTNCFDVSLQLTVAIADVDRMHARAAAWATADLLALSELDDLPDPSLPCISAALQSTVAKQIFPTDLGDQFTEVWLSQAEASLSRNRSTVAILPFTQLTQPQGWLTMLRARGYEVKQMTESWSINPEGSPHQ